MSRGHVLPTVPDVRARAACRAVRWEQVTIGYNVVEGVVAVTAGVAAGQSRWSGSGSTQ